MRPTLEKIIQASGLHPSRVFNVYIFGPQVYGTSNKDSDWDIIMVANNSVESTEMRKGLYNIHVYTPNKFDECFDRFASCLILFFIVSTTGNIQMNPIIRILHKLFNKHCSFYCASFNIFN